MKFLAWLIPLAAAIKMLILTIILVLGSASQLKPNRDRDNHLFILDCHQRLGKDGRLKLNCISCYLNTLLFSILSQLHKQHSTSTLYYRLACNFRYHVLCFSLSLLLSFLPVALMGQKEDNCLMELTSPDLLPQPHGGSIISELSFPPSFSKIIL